MELGESDSVQVLRDAESEICYVSLTATQTHATMIYSYVQSVHCNVRFLPPASSLNQFLEACPQESHTNQHDHEILAKFLQPPARQTRLDCSDQLAQH